MNRLTKFKSEFDHPALKLSLASLIFVIIVMSFVTSALAVTDVYVTVTNYNECVEAGGSAGKSTCTIGGESFPSRDTNNFRGTFRDWIIRN